MKIIVHTLRLVVVSLIAACLSGCLVHHYGDAKLQRNSDAVSITTDRFYLKPVPLDRAATHVLQVCNLPFPIYPTHLVMPIIPTEAELKQNFPWTKARLRIEFRAPDGAAFFSKEIALSEAEPGRSPGTRHQLELQFRPAERQSWKAPANMPQHTDYDVVVTVLEASKNKIHRVTLYADTYVR